MNRISQYREAWRKIRRQEQLATFKKNVRNLIYYHHPEQQSPECCPICIDDRWIYAEDIRDIIQLILTIFHSQYICSNHIDTLISKTIECLYADPAIFSRLINEGKQKREIIYRKIFLLLQIFDNRLNSNEDILWDYIEDNFKKKSDFIVRLMDSAYSFNEWVVEDDYDEIWDSEVKSICYNSVLNMFGKWPQLFSSYLEEYPINILLQKSKGKRRVELLSLIKVIISYSEEKGQSQSTVCSLFKGFKLHLEDVKRLQQSLEVFVAQLQLFHIFSTVWNCIDQECISSILCLIKENQLLKDYTCELIMTSLLTIRDRYIQILNHQSISEIDQILSIITANIEQIGGERIIEQKMEMEEEV